jgi:hypothetical protein
MNNIIPLFTKAGNLSYINLINKHEHVFSNLKNIYAAKNGNNTSSPGKQIALQAAIVDDSIHLFQLTDKTIDYKIGLRA